MALPFLAFLGVSMTEQENKLTTGQAARLLGISAERVRQLVREGKLDATSTPLGLLFDLRAVGELLAERRQTKGREAAAFHVS